MGADIHMVLEKKTETGWVGIHDFGWEILHALSAQMYSVHFPARERNYDRFAALAGVRGSGPSPKGMPDDVSELARMHIDADGDDGHSHTHYTIREAAEIFGRTSGQTPVAAQVAAKLLNEPKPRPPCEKYFGIDEDVVDAYRVVIWFDN